MKRYLFEIDAEGKPIKGTVVEYPDEYTVEGTEEVWLNTGRSTYVNGEWVITPEGDVTDGV
jgi:hypothetical protein